MDYNLWNAIIISLRSLSPPPPDLFVSFRFMMGFDILINGSDRDEGKASNILITEEGVCADRHLSHVNSSRDLTKVA
jgi:hypothetical protein